MRKFISLAIRTAIALIGFIALMCDCEDMVAFTVSKIVGMAMIVIAVMPSVVKAWKEDLN